MTYRSFGLVVAALVGLFACTPESRNSLPDEYRVAPDARLLGQWRAEPDSDDLRIQVSQRDPLEFAALTSETVKTETGTRIKLVEYRLRAFELDGRRILAIQELVPPSGHEASWLLATYRFDEAGNAELFLMDEVYVRQLVKSGQLGGTIRGSETQFPEVLITAPPEALDDLIQTSDPARLFTARLGPFVRLAP